MMSTQLFPIVSGIAGCVLLMGTSSTARSDDGQLHLTLRSRVRTDAASNTNYPAFEKKAVWDPKKTALIICDMWDDHWCKSAARRVGELAGPMNEVIKAA